MSRRPDFRTRREMRVRALLDERFGPAGDIVREAIAKPNPLRPLTAEEWGDDLTTELTAEHRGDLVDALPFHGGPRGTRGGQKRRGPGSLPQSRAAVPSPNQTTTVDEGGRVSRRPAHRTPGPRQDVGGER